MPSPKKLEAEIKLSEEDEDILDEVWNEIEKSGFAEQSERDNADKRER